MPGELKTHISNKANLSHRVTEELLHELVKRGLVEISKGQRWTAYRTTQKGRRFLANMATVKGIFEGAARPYIPSLGTGPEGPRKAFRTISDPVGKFSTGSEALDQLLGGGYLRGSSVVLELGEGVTISQYLLVLMPTVWNFIAKGRSVLSIPSKGLQYSAVQAVMAAVGIGDDTLNSLLRMCVPKPCGELRLPWIIEFEGEDIDKDFHEFFRVADELAKQTGQPQLYVVGVDTLWGLYGTEALLRWGRLAATTMVRERGNLCILILNPECASLSEAISMEAHTHLRFEKKYGALVLCSLKPRTSLCAVEADRSQGYPMPRLEHCPQPSERERDPVP